MFTNVLSAQTLGGYYSAKISGKDYHLFLGLSGSYLYQVGGMKTYFLKKEILLGTIRTFEIFESSRMTTNVGKVKIADGKLENFELNAIKATNVKLKPLKLPIQQISIAKQIYNNEKCSFKFIDLNQVNNIYLFKETSFLISEVMDAFKDYGCDYLKSSRVSEMNESLNQLVCENETLLMKERFYGISFMCRANLANSTDFKYKVFSIMFDKNLKARIAKNDFTDSDISAEDDSRHLEFRLTPVGLGLYSTDLHENKEEYLRIIPFVDIKKNFRIWGKPKRYLNNFSLK